MYVIESYYSPLNYQYIFQIILLLLIIVLQVIKLWYGQLFITLYGIKFKLLYGKQKSDLIREKSIGYIYYLS